jgi:hypothetical protein
MPKKKKSKKSLKSLLRSKAFLLSAAALLAVLVALVVLRPFGSDDDLKVTAPAGTLSRDGQLDASEISGETGIDGTYDDQQSTNMQRDANLLGEVSGTADDD